MGKKVTCYYAPPATEKVPSPPVQKHQLWNLDYEDAKRGPEGHLWSLTPPKKGDVEDLTPKPLDVRAQESSPPPIMDRPAPGPSLGGGVGPGRVTE